MPTLNKSSLNNQSEGSSKFGKMVQSSSKISKTNASCRDGNINLIYSLMSLSEYSFQYYHGVEIMVTVSEVHLILGLMNKIQKSCFSASVQYVISIISVKGFLVTVKSYLLMLAEEGLYSPNFNWNIFFTDLLAYLRFLCGCQTVISSNLNKVSKNLKQAIYLAKEMLSELVKHKHIISLPNLLDEVEKLLEFYLKSSKQLYPKQIYDSVWDPYPTISEISQDSFPKINFDPYTSLNTYMKYAFIVLKEDFLFSLREGLNQLKCELNGQLKREKNFNIYFYENVTFVDFTLDPTSWKKIGYQIRIEEDFQLKGIRKRKTNRLLFGSLLLFSQDNFKTFFLGLVTDRKILDQGDNLLEVVLIKDAPKNVILSSYSMVEPSIFFEPYHQVLNCLKSLSSCHYSMGNYLISRTLEPLYPKYLNLSTNFNIFGFKVDVCNFKSWPSAFELNMDQFQLEAMKNALTNQFCLIQGPPGTGKTYLGLKIIEIFIKNWRIWNVPYSPILVVCYTNHALDQFLEGILPVTDKIIRIGGQSKSKTLINYNLRFIKKKPFRKNEKIADFHSSLKKTINYSMNKIINYRKSINIAKRNIGIVHYDLLKNVMSPIHKSFLNSEQIFISWLMEQSRLNTSECDDSNNIISQEKNIFHIKSEFAELKKDLKDVENVLSYHINLCDLELKLIHLVKKIENIKVKDLEPQQIKFLIANVSDFISELAVYKFVKKNICKPFQCSHFEDSSIIDLTLLSSQERWNLYFHWQNQVVLQMESSFKELISQHNELCEFFKDVCNMEDYVNIQEFGTHVVGVTTTGAARYSKLLSILKPKIVIIEEAAEILEAHTVTSLTRGCQHVIMIGDHYQLKPSTATYEFTKEYKLDVSLFERLIKKGLPVYSLRTQRRMRPEIASLVSPLIYRHLDSHSSVFDYPNVKGVKSNLFFINHNIYEEEISDSHSHRNVKEADFLLALCCYLIRQGYDPLEITVLTTYLAQETYMISKRNCDKSLKDVRITVVDNYQGEENNIILLSLVRSNKNNRIGFLTSRNRMCVALTRAKIGMFIVGNMDCLERASDLWKKLRLTLIKNNSFGSQLELECLTHGNRTFVSPTTNNNMKHGGCDKICNAVLMCGHNCDKICHGNNIDHNMVKCREKCERYCSGGHLCKLLCFEDCDLCTECDKNTVNETCNEIRNTRKKKKEKIKSLNNRISTDLPDSLSVSNPNEEVEKNNCEDDFELNFDKLIENTLEENIRDIKNNLNNENNQFCGNDELAVAEEETTVGDIFESLNNIDCLEMNQSSVNATNIDVLSNSSDSSNSFIDNLYKIESKQFPSLVKQNKIFNNNTFYGDNKDVEVNLNDNSVQLEGKDVNKEVCDGTESELNEVETEINIKVFPSIVKCPDSMTTLETQINPIDQLVCKTGQNFLSDSIDQFLENMEDLSKSTDDLNAINKTLPHLSIEESGFAHASDICDKETSEFSNTTNLICDNTICSTSDKQISELTFTTQSLYDEKISEFNQSAEFKQEATPSFISITNQLIAFNDTSSNAYSIVNEESSIDKGISSINEQNVDFKERKRSFNLLDEYKSLNISSFEISNAVAIKKLDDTLSLDESYEANENMSVDVNETIILEDASFNGCDLLNLNDNSTMACDNFDENILNQDFSEFVPEEIDNTTLKLSTENGTFTCNQKLKCGHLCLKKCGNGPCKTSKCDVIMRINLPCNHINNVKCYLSLNCLKGTVVAESLQEHCQAKCDEVLDCGHKCQGTCSTCSQGRFHEKCTQTCSKTLLCGHLCTKLCWEDDHTCFEICCNKCIHQACSRNCKDECIICQEKCEWKCEHFECTMTCGEMCNRPLCMFGCTLTLSCGHPCAGFCGEPCPPICLSCQPSDEFNLLDHRFVLLEECGHCFEWASLLKSLDINKLSVKRCPTCESPIWQTLRLKSFILQNNWNLKFVLRSERSQQMFNVDMKTKILETLTFLREYISEEVLCNGMFQRLLQYTIDNMALILNGADTSNQRIVLKSLLFIQIYLKEISQFTRSFDVFKIKYYHRQLIFLRINLLLKQLYKRKETSSLDFIQFEYESLKIHRMAVFFLLHKEYFQLDKRSQNKKLLDDLCSKAFSYANSTNSYSLSDDKHFFNIISEFKNVIGSSIPLTVSTEMFEKSFECSMLPLFRKKHCHVGDWQICLKGHPYQKGGIQERLFGNHCNICKNDN